MSYLFLLPLFTAALAAYFWQKSSDEIAYLASAATVISLVLSLVLAPWQIQLLILLTVVIVVTFYGKDEKSRRMSPSPLRKPPARKSIVGPPIWSQQSPKLLSRSEGVNIGVRRLKSPIIPRWPTQFAPHLSNIAALVQQTRTSNQ